MTRIHRNILFYLVYRGFNAISDLNNDVHRINNSIKFARCYRTGSMLYYSYLPYRQFRKADDQQQHEVFRYLPYRKFRK